MEIITTIISNLGFPIATAIFAGFFIYKIWNTQLTQEEQREQRYSEQIERFSTALNDFNVTLNKIDERLENLEDTIKEVIK